ncbi:MAG: DUF1611 domain-containing protein [Pirellulales bacterium]
MSAKLIILTEGNTNPLTAKTAASVIRYRTDEVVAILDSTCRGKTSGELLGVGGSIPVVGSLDEAPQADTLLIGIAPAGGKIPPAWRRLLLEAIDRGLDVISGLHDFLSDDAELSAAAAQRGVTLHDVRKNNERSVARRRGIREACLRLQTVGTDCSVGKMVVAIELTRALVERGHDAKFLATGQTGIMIAGEGCPIDCVVADFISGAVEQMVIDHQQHEIILFEGQGSLYHPSYSSVTLGLLHGAVPDGLILCYEAGRQGVRGIDEISLPNLTDARRLYETMAQIMHPCRVIAVAMNGRNLTDTEARAERERVSSELELPVCDVMRDDPDVLADAALKLKRELGK